MAATKSLTALQTSATNTAGSTTTSSVFTATTSYGSVVFAQVTNGATAPTLPCAANLQYSGDNTNFYTAQSQTAGLTASALYPMWFEVPPAVMYFRIQFTGNTAQSVTVLGHCESLTAL